MPRMTSQGRHHVMPGMTCCHIVHDTVFFAGMIVMWFGQLWLVLADLAILRLCWAKRAPSADSRPWRVL